DIRRGDSEELLALVDLVDPLVSELAVERSFDAYRILGEEHGVDVEGERYGSVTHLSHSVHRLQATGHTDLHDTFPEGSDVGDDIDVSGADIRRPVISLGDLL